MKSIKSKIIVVIISILCALTVGTAVLLVSKNNDEPTNSQPATKHICVADYSITENNGLIVEETSRCVLCGDVTYSHTLDADEFEVLTPEDLTDNAITLSSANKKYVLNGTFSNSKIKFDAVNIFVIGSYATTSNMVFSYTSNGGATVYGCNVADITADLYANVAYVKCTIGILMLNLKVDNIDVLVDSCDIRAGVYNAVYINYGYKDAEDGLRGNYGDITVANCVFNEGIQFPIMIIGQSAEVAEIGDVEIVNNEALKGWGGAKDKRGFLKVQDDKNLAPIDYARDDLTDTSLLTDKAYALAKKILASGNRLDKNGSKCCVLNFGDIHFDTLD